jgi:hypothetical protein
MKNKTIKILLLTAGLLVAASAVRAQGLYSRRAATSSVPASTEKRAGVYNAEASMPDDSGILRAGDTEGGTGQENKVTDETIPVGEGMSIFFAGSLLYLLLSRNRFRARQVLPQAFV